MKKDVFVRLALQTVVCGVQLVYPVISHCQQHQGGLLSYEDYISEYLEDDYAYLAEVDEWSTVISDWLENPVCLNNEEADALVEYKIISLFQLNKLKEYRYMYGDLLTLYELSFIDGWDFQTVRKTMPLVTVKLSGNPRTTAKFHPRMIRQSLVLKTSINTETTAGYISEADLNADSAKRIYAGSPLRVSARYTFEYRKRLILGFSAEKDPGEPLLVGSAPDLTSGYLEIKKLGPVRSMIIGNYRVSYGYGLNISGGMTTIKNQNGLSGMAHQVRPKTSMSESGYFRGLSVTTQSGPVELTAFVSSIKADGTSIITDSLTGKPLSFGSINKSGYHRTGSELENRKKITEQTAGAFIVFMNQWLKAGLIGLYSRYNALLAPVESPYALFKLTGRDNFTGGFSTTVWMPGFCFFNESSLSRNKGLASVSGIQLRPVAGTDLLVSHRYFGINYQNSFGSGYSSSGSNTGENGLLVSFRVELPKKWLIEFKADHTRKMWVSYDLPAPAKRKELSVLIEKAWRTGNLVQISARYRDETVDIGGQTEKLCRPGQLAQVRIRLEGRYGTESVRFKNRLEFSMIAETTPSWLIFQDIEWKPENINLGIWARISLFQAPEWVSAISAYENDVLYDFTSFVHYGKGLRGVIMTKSSLLEWMDVWIRFSTVYYMNKRAGSGWDEAYGNRQNEIELQVRINLPG